MKTKLLKKLRKQFAAQYQVRFEESGILPGYHMLYVLYRKERVIYSNNMQWSLLRSFPTEAEVKEYLRYEYESFIERYLSEHRTKRIRNELTYPW